MSQGIYRVFICEYPGCFARYFGDVNDAEAGEGWGQTDDNKDLCPDHMQYWLDHMAEFWEPTIGRHIAQELADDIEADDSMQEATLKDEDILHTNMPEMNVKVTTPAGTIEGHVEEDW